MRRGEESPNMPPQSKIHGRFLRSWENRYVKVLKGQVLIGGSWNLVIYGQGLQHHILLDYGPFASERDPVFKFWLCLCPLALQGG